MNRIGKPYGRVIKKAFALIFLLCLILSLGAVAAGGEDADIIGSACTAVRDGTASVTFNLKENPGMFSLILKVEYDSSVLTLKSVKNGSIFPDSETVMGSLEANPFTYSGYATGIVNISATGLIVTFNFTVNKDAAFGTYPVKVTQATGYNVSYSKFNIASENGSVTVVECLHAEKEWRVVKAAECEKVGAEALICKKCGETIDTRAVKATGHKHIETRNAVAATAESEGYTGDRYCKDCGKLISTGKTVAKLTVDTTAVNPPETNAPETSAPETSAPETSVPETSAPETSAPETSAPETSMPETSAPETSAPLDIEPKIKSGTGSTYVKDSGSPLIFVSDADFDEFVRVEIDGEILSEDNYSAESGSTVITVKSDFLNGLSNGQHTVYIVSTGGTASTQFIVRNDYSSADTDGGTSAKPIIIISVIVIVLIIGATAFCFVFKGRYM